MYEKWFQENLSQKQNKAKQNLCLKSWGFILLQDKHTSGHTEVSVVD